MFFGLKNKKYQNRQRRSLVDRAPQQTDLFKRNKTVPGVSVKTTSPKDSSRQKVHSLSRKRKKLATMFGFVVIIIAILLLLIFNFTFKVAIAPSGQLSESIPADRYEQIITNFLDEHFMQRFHFLLNNQQLEKYFLVNNPEIKSATMGVGDQFGQTKFFLKMRQPIASWLVNGQQYYVDGQGVTFKYNYYQEPLLKIFDETDAPLEMGEIIITQKVLSFIGKTIDRLDDKGLKVVKIILPSGEMRRIDFVIDGVGAVFKLSVDRPIGEQVEDLERALSYFTQRNLSPDYIDLRLKNKAYYK